MENNNMTDSFLGLENWINKIENNQQKHKISEFLNKIIQIKLKWIKSFQVSIDLWINFMLLRIQNSIQDYNLRNKNNITQNTKLIDIENQITETLRSTQFSVSQGIKNIQKLYMIPELRQKQKKYQKQSEFQRKGRLKSKSHEKNRSSSLTSSFSRNRKTSIFMNSNTKLSTVQNSYGKNSMNITSQNFNRFLKQNNCHITKHQKQKPKYSSSTNSFKPNLTSNLQCISKINSSSVSVDLLNRSAQDYFLDKQKKKQKQLQNKLEEKLKYIEGDLNQKLNKIIQSLQQNKSVLKTAKALQQSRYLNRQNKLNSSSYILNKQNEQKQKQNNSFAIEKNKKDFNQRQNNNNYLKKENKNFSSQLLQNKQVIKRNSIAKKCISNPIRQQSFEEAQCEQQIKLKQMQQNITVNQVQVLKNPQIAQRKSKIENDMNQLLVSSSKVKLPIQELIQFFVSQYINLCQLNKLPVKLESMGYQKTKSQIKRIQTKQGKQLAKKKFKTMNVVLKTINQKDDPKNNLRKQLINQLSRKCIKCSYSIVLNQEYQLKDDTTTELNKLIQILELER